MKQLPFGKSPEQSKGPRVTVEGEVTRVAFSNPDNGWSVIRLKVEGRVADVTAVGTLPGVREGEHLRLSGSWKQDRRYGEQLAVESCIPVAPGTQAGMERYLASGMVEGIGPVMAARLVGAFGLDTFEVIEEHPERITEVEGIGPKRKAQILAAWQSQKAIKDVMLFLQTHGISPSFSVKIYKKYGDRAVAVIKENPYQLAVDIWGIGFASADAIALELGLSRTSPRRAEAGVLHVLGELRDEGHVYCPRGRLVDSAVQILEIDEPIISAAVDELARLELVVVEDEAVYLRGLHAAELAAAERLVEILQTPAEALKLDLDRALSRVEREQGFSLAEQQRQAVRQATRSKVLVITGGPGTGKTTLVNAIIRIVEKKERVVLLCAPTGRAAKRMNETTGREAKTIHRMLEFDPREMKFLRDADNPLDADLLVVDEVSMVDTMLLHGLLQAVPVTCQLVLVGDVDQLPSVGPGSVLGDLIASGAVDVVQLTEIFRQAAESLIVVNAHRVNRGQEPQLPERGADADFFFIERDRPDDILATLEEVVCRRIPKRFNVDAVEQIQVLTPMHRGLLGSINLNAHLQQVLNPQGRAVSRGSRQFRVGDKVMQIRNNYDLEVYNGDIGRVLALDEEQRKVTVTFDERPVSYEPSDLDELVLGYACSIHKSQGSEYPVVVIPLHTQHYTMLQRNLIYTALTRGRRLVVLIGSAKAVGLAVRNHRENERFTGLARRLRAP